MRLSTRRIRPDQFLIPVVLLILFKTIYELNTVSIENVLSEIHHKPCTFGEIEGEEKKEGVVKGPIPVILMALGRSGSSITWMTLSKLTGHENIAFELTGGNAPKSANFFNELKQFPIYDHDWAHEQLCDLKEGYPNAGIVGFQWKPYMSSWDLEYSLKGLEDITKYKNPPVRVIYLTRNALDRRVSNYRHAKSRATPDKITAHCEVGDTECLKRHEEYAQNVELPTGHDLKSWLKQSDKHEAKIMDRLDQFHVEWLKVSYEGLFRSDNTDEWIRIFKFLGRGPRNLTMEELKTSFTIAPTTSKKRSEIVSNYDKVVKTLTGSKWEHLLEE